MRRRSLVAFLSLMSVLSAADEPSSVCQLLRTMPAHSGEYIKVRARYFVSPEAAGIDDPNCSDLIDINGRTFVPAIWLARPGVPRLPSRYPEKVPYDESAMKGFEKLATEARAKGRNVVATFKGRLEYCPRLVTFQYNGRTAWMGCGNGSFPLQLVLGTVEDANVEQPSIPPPPNPNVR